MSMYPQKIGSIPTETVRIVQAACPKGTLATRLRDALGELYQDEQFALLYPVLGQPTYAPWRLALVTVLQYSENLTDRQAANAVRERIDWKYALGLDLSDAGFDYSLLSAFRTRLIEEQAETLLLDRLVHVCKEHGWLKEGGKQRTDSTHVLARVRSLSNLECVGETLRAALDDLAALAPDWLMQQISSDWFERYSHRVENSRLPKAENQRTILAQQIGADGVHLLAALHHADAPAELSEVASVQMLREVWQQYYDLSGGVKYARYISASQFKRSCRREWLENDIALTMVPFSDSQVFHSGIQVGVTTKKKGGFFRWRADDTFSLASREC